MKLVITEVFQEVILKRSLSAKLYDIATYLLTRDIFANVTSGIVVAGFGTNEIYPAILTFEVEGIFEGKLKYGFIWVKRKHYFPSDLNQHFFQNYFRGV